MAGFELTRIGTMGEFARDWKGAKFIREIVFLDRDILGFWEVRGYSNTADPWTEDRRPARASTGAPPAPASSG